MFDQPADQPAPGESPAPIGMRELPPQPAKPVMPAYATPVAAAPRPEPARSAPDDSVVARDDHLEGTFTSRGTIRVLGSLKGRIEAVRVHIEEGAHVEADVIVDEAIVAGAFTGNLTCRQRLEAHASGRISGRVETHKLMLHEGASVEGEMHMLTEEGRDASETIRGAAPIRGAAAPASVASGTEAAVPIVAPTARSGASKSSASKPLDGSRDVSASQPVSDVEQGSAGSRAEASGPRPEASSPPAEGANPRVEAVFPVRRSLVAETLRAETMRLTPRVARPASAARPNGARVRNGTTTGF